MNQKTAGAPSVPRSIFLYDMNMITMDPDKLFFPKELSNVIGLSKNEIAFLKKRGCPFYGRKTSVRWVREFLAEKAGAPMPPQPAHPRYSTSCIPSEPDACCDLLAA
ncbi:MAG: hypothetical protein D4R65_13325 [Verrucomicrobiaceae bacterium]|nr:MAG: hypothetical protein D4R65_13325 [Verrucomicrobiaceae bacterium]